MGIIVGSLCICCSTTYVPTAANCMLFDGSYVRPVCKPGSGVGHVVPEPLGQGNCTLSCIFYFILLLLIEIARDLPCMEFSSWAHILQPNLLKMLKKCWIAGSV